jgi:hypothetical protein
MLKARSAWDVFQSSAIQNDIHKSLVFLKKSTPFAEVHFPDSTADVSQAFQSLLMWGQTESISILDRTAWIEPEQGWIVCDPLHIVNDCLIDGSFAD